MSYLLFTFSASDITTGEFDHDVTLPVLGLGMETRTTSERAYTAGKTETNFSGYTTCIRKSAPWIKNNDLTHPLSQIPGFATGWLGLCGFSSGRNLWTSGNWRFRPFVSSPPGRIQHRLVTLYILSFIIVKLRLTTFIKANDDDDPVYSVKTQAPGGETSWGQNVHGANWRRVEMSINLLDV